MKIASSGSADLLTLRTLAFFLLGRLILTLENNLYKTLLNGAITIGLTTKASNIVNINAANGRAVKLEPIPKKQTAVNTETIEKIVTLV